MMAEAMIHAQLARPGHGKKGTATRQASAAEKLIPAPDQSRSRPPRSATFHEACMTAASSTQAITPAFTPSSSLLRTAVRLAFPRNCRGIVECYEHRTRPGIKVLLEQTGSKSDIPCAAAPPVWQGIRTRFFG